jgi:hypothetical protein
MKQSRFKLGRSITQFVPVTFQKVQQVQPQATKQKNDSIISWKLIEVFGFIVAIKIIVFLLLL